MAGYRRKSRRKHRRRDPDASMDRDWPNDHPGHVKAGKLGARRRKAGKKKAHRRATAPRRRAHRAIARRRAQMHPRRTKAFLASERAMGRRHKKLLARQRAHRRFLYRERGIGARAERGLERQGYYAGTSEEAIGRRAKRLMRRQRHTRGKKFFRYTRVHGDRDAVYAREKRRGRFRRRHARHRGRDWPSPDKAETRRHARAAALGYRHIAKKSWKPRHKKFHGKIFSTAGTAKRRKKRARDPEMMRDHRRYGRGDY